MCNYFSLARVAFLSSLLFLASCDDDEPVKDQQNPSISIIAPSSTGIVRATTAIKATIEDQSLKEVKVLVDGVSIHEATTGAIEVSWDTKSVADGNHAIKIVATDQSNNTSEASLTVEVLNKLMSITLPPATLMDSEELWYFISNKQGTVIDTKQVENGQTITFDTYEGYVKGETVELHRLRVHNQDRNFDFRSVHNVAPGSYTYYPYYTYGQPPATIGQYTATVSNIPYTFARPHVVGDGFNNWSGSGSNGTYTLTLDLNKTISGLLLGVSNYDDPALPPRYTTVAEAASGGSVSLDYNTMTEMVEKSVDLGGEYIYVGSDIHVFPQQDDYSKSYYLTSVNHPPATYSSLKFFSPGNLYPMYSIGIYCVNDNLARYYYKAGALPTVMKTLTSSVTTFTGENRTLKISTSGEYDVMFVSANELKEVEGSYYLVMWNYMAGGETNYSLSIPAIPASILAEYPILSSFSTKKFDGITLYEYVGIEGYDEFQEYDFSANKQFLERYKEAYGTQWYYDGYEIVGRPKSKAFDPSKHKMYLP